MLNTFLYILIAIAILSVIIIIHELGHFIVGRKLGIGVTEFSVGMGPKLFGWHRNGTDYSVRAFLLGGFCKFVGEDEENAAPNAFNNAPVWKRILTVAAGPVMNFVLAYVAALILLHFFTLYEIFPSIDTLIEDMPAAEAELQPGDVINFANGVEIDYNYMGIETLREIILENDSLTLNITRGNENFDLTLVPEIVTDGTTSVKQIGVTFTARFIHYPFPQIFVGAAKYMVEQTQMLFDVLRDLIFKGEGAEEIAGPVGTVAVITTSMQSDANTIWLILFMISLNLGIMNLLPLPALDGGRLIFLIVEGVRGKPVPPEKEGIVHGIGFLLFLVLAVVLLFHDVNNLFLN